MKDTIILISLPRTGTTSFCAMLNTLGYQTIHAPQMSYKDHLKPGWGLADTPMFAHSIIGEIKKQPLDVKFVYIDRDFESWFNSMTVSEPLFQTYTRLSQRSPDQLNHKQAFDVKYYTEVFSELNYGEREFKNRMQLRFYEHQDICLTDHNPFIYNFNDGWESLCKFLGTEIPDSPIPHLHKKT